MLGVGVVGQVRDGLELGQPGDRDQQVELPRTVLQVHPEVVGLVAREARQVK